ncbi:hypothetical protein BKK51_07145 [Rodentibacter trehalosifermentans]|uniref:Uncharacterized protein n=1 Tax=Rodentibacter trehalosifermentans TaxID=1908263 RepID=A0A1V3ISE2_9PAST|nr:hypothetical protein [Rodentibacter trehalosifermentans]OOF45198.1 hypothetical protein BKK51_07145 [Rodentibacter trehalosifermentans]
MKPYRKALILFPLILQGLATALFWFLDWDLDVSIPFSHYLFIAFILATIPAFLIALVATKYRYVRYNILSIVLCSSLIGFFYFYFIAYLLVVIKEPDISIWTWLIKDGLVLGLLNMFGMVFYSLFVLPFLLPKTKS